MDGKWPVVPKQRMRRVPTKPGTERLFYRNGQLRQEESYLGGERHGARRTWHRNGVLASEEFYEHNLLHGECAQWAEDGRLLGKFRMNHGTGIQREWFDDGRLHMEISTVNGKFTGRTRVWLRDGTLVVERWTVENREITRRNYRAAAKQHSEYPDFKADGARVLPRSKVEKREFELHAAWLLSRPDRREANEWLSESSAKSRSLGRFSHRQATNCVEHLYQAGARSVWALFISESKRGEQFAEALLVELPKEPKARRTVRKAFAGLPKTVRPPVMPDRDCGESHLYIALE